MSDEHMSGGPDAESEDLLARLSALPREVEPETDLWPGIEKQLTPRLTGPASEPARVIPLWPAVAAGLAAAAALALWWPSGEGPTEAPTQIADADPSPAPAPAEDDGIDDQGPLPAPEPDLLPVESEYRSAAIVLASAIDDRRDELPNELTTTLDQNLGVVDEAIASSRAALADNPEDPELQTLLDDAYQQKLDLLEQVATYGGLDA